MSLTYTISSDLSAWTQTLTILSGATTIESIVYSLSANSFVFANIPSFPLSASDFLSFCSILDSYWKSITDCFKYKNTMQPFYINSVSDQNDGSKTLSFSFYQSVHPLYSISAVYPSGKVSFSQRTQTSTLTYEEWTYYHSVSSHFESEIKIYFNLS